MKTFFILSLPRSRTAWLANFLTYENSYCFHEGLLEGSNAAALSRLFASTGKPIVGNSDCGNILFMDELRASFPEAKLVIVERPLGEVVDELNDMGLNNYDPKLLERAEDLLSLAKQWLDALVLNFNDLDESACRHIWHHCIGTPFDENRWRMLDGLDIQIILSKKLEAIRRNGANLESLIGRAH